LIATALSVFFDKVGISPTNYYLLTNNLKSYVIHALDELKSVTVFVETPQLNLNAHLLVDKRQFLMMVISE
jgi:hypothetical protein